jgi:hypothetical protein
MILAWNACAVIGSGSFAVVDRIGGNRLGSQ